MTDHLSDDRLVAVLASIGQHLALPGDAALPTPATEPAWPARPWYRNRVLVAAAIVAVVVAATITIAPARQAVARWLGLGSTRIEVGPQQPAGGVPIVAGLAPIALVEAVDLLGRPLPASDSLGRPDAVYAMPAIEGGVLLAWNHNATTLWLHPGNTDGAVRNAKRLGPQNQIEPVAGLGDFALLVTGEHLLQTPHRAIAATTVVLWTAGGFEYRLESNGPPASVVAAARSFR